MKNLLFSFVLLSLPTSSLADWYKGNTHAHSSRSDGDAKPHFVANWYHQKGYNFLVLSEHNKFIDPKSISIKNQRKDFILVPGVEVTGANYVHTSAFNVKKVVPWKTKLKNRGGDSDRACGENPGPGWRGHLQPSQLPLGPQG